MLLNTLTYFISKSDSVICSLHYAIYTPWPIKLRQL